MRRLALLVAFSATVACGSSDSTGVTDLSVTGVYVLLTVNGTALPFTTSSTTQITEGSLRLDGGHTYSHLTTLKETIAGISTIKYDGADGFWTRSGTTVNVTTTTGATQEASFLDGLNELIVVLVQNGTSLTYRYKK